MQVLLAAQVQAAGSSGSRWQCSRLTLTLTRLGRAAPGSGQGMSELVRTCRGSNGVQVQARAAGTACGAIGAVMLWRRERPGADLGS